MPNGHAIALPELASVFTAADRGGAAPVKVTVEAAGEAMVAAAAALAQGLVEYWEHGAISAAAKATGAERLAVLVEAHLHNKIDFAVARRQGREIFHARLDGAAPAGLDAKIDLLLDEVVAMVTAVTELVGGHITPDGRWVGSERAPSAPGRLLVG